MKVIISAAGTGGHINPGIAIANKIKEEEKDSEVIFIGTNRGIENDLVPRAGYELKTIEAYGFSKKLTIRNLKNMIATYKSVKKSKKILQEFKPDVVIGTGGYICGPVFAAATTLKIPCILHESNAYPGRAVKVFSKKVDKVLVGFEAAKARLKNAKKVVVTGTPTKVRKIDIENTRKQEILNELGIKSNLPIVLVFGGSQGAKVINEAILGIIDYKLNKKYEIVWATGLKQFDIVKCTLEEKGININKIENVKILPYIYNMEEIMNIVDLLICRSGAMTITELSIVGKPAIFIPLPSIAANRQEENARVMEKIGAAKVILNNEVNYLNLNEMVESLIVDDKKLKNMGQNANKLEIKDVDNKIYKEIKEIVNVEKSRKA